MGILFKCRNDKQWVNAHTSYKTWHSLKLKFAKTCKMIINNMAYDNELPLQHYYDFFKTYKKKSECKGVIYLLGQSNTSGYFTYSQCKHILDMIYMYDNIVFTFTEKMFLTTFIQVLNNSVIYRKKIYIL